MIKRDLNDVQRSYLLRDTTNTFDWVVGIVNGIGEINYPAIQYTMCCTEICFEM